MSASAGRLVATELRRVRYRFLSAVVGCSAAGVGLIAVSTFVYQTNHSLGPEDLRRSVTFSVAPLVVAALVLSAATFGADLPTRALTTMLLYEPRRQRVLAARAGVCAVWMAALTLVALTVLTLTLLPSLTTPGGDAGWWISMAGVIGRGSLLSAAAAVTGVALAALTRGTVGAIAVTAGYAFLVEQTAAFWPPRSRWLPIADAVSWITADGPHSPLAAGALLAALVLTLATAANLTFHHQDIP